VTFSSRVLNYRKYVYLVIIFALLVNSWSKNKNNQWQDLLRNLKGTFVCNTLYLVKKKMFLLLFKSKILLLKYVSKYRVYLL